MDAERDIVKECDKLSKQIVDVINAEFREMLDTFAMGSAVNNAERPRKRYKAVVELDLLAYDEDWARSLLIGCIGERTGPHGLEGPSCELHSKILSLEEA